MLDFVDQIHSDLHIRTCALVDASKFDGVSAPCLYSATHGGISWYMSHNYVIDTFEDPYAAVRATNESIRNWFFFWNELDYNRRLTNWICMQLPREEINMIKYYNENIKLHKVSSAPWFFTFDNNRPTFGPIETIPFEHAFMKLFRLQDCVNTIPGLTWEDVKDKYIQFHDNNEFTILEEKEVRSIERITTPLSYLIYDTKNTNWKRYFTELYPHITQTLVPKKTCSVGIPLTDFIIVLTKTPTLQLVGWKTNENQFRISYPLQDRQQIKHIFLPTQSLDCHPFELLSPFVIRFLLKKNFQEKKIFSSNF